MYLCTDSLQVISLALILARPAPAAVESGALLKTADGGERYQSRGTLVVCKVTPSHWQRL